jgi:molecular chaperone HtpG
MAENQEKIYYVTGENADRLRKLPQVETLASKGYDTLLLTDDVDEFIPQVLGAYEEKSFCNAATEDLGLQTEEEKKAAEEKAEQLKGFVTFVKETLGERLRMCVFPPTWVITPWPWCRKEA